MTEVVLTGVISNVTQQSPTSRERSTLNLRKHTVALVGLYYGQTALGDAENAAQKILELDSNYQPAHKLLEDIKQAYVSSGHDYLSKNQYNETVAKFRKVIDIDPDHKSAHHYLGKAYYWSGMFADAICSCSNGNCH